MRRSIFLPIALWMTVAFSAASPAVSADSASQPRELTINGAFDASNVSIGIMTKIKPVPETENQFKLLCQPDDLLAIACQGGNLTLFAEHAPEIMNISFNELHIMVNGKVFATQLGSPESWDWLKSAPAATLETVCSVEITGTENADLSSLKRLDGKRLTLTTYNTAELKDILPAINPRGLMIMNDTNPEWPILPKLTNLRFLALLNMRENIDLSPLSRLTGLNYLLLGDCGAVDISPLSNLSSLKTVHLMSCGGVKDLTPLVKLTNLKLLELLECSSLTDAAVDAFIKAKPECKIVGYERESDANPARAKAVCCQIISKALLAQATIGNLPNLKQLRSFVDERILQAMTDDPAQKPKSVYKGYYFVYYTRAKDATDAHPTIRSVCAVPVDPKPGTLMLYRTTETGDLYEADAAKNAPPQFLTLDAELDKNLWKTTFLEE